MKRIRISCLTCSFVVPCWFFWPGLPGLVGLQSSQRSYLQRSSRFNFSVEPLSLSVDEFSKLGEFQKDANAKQMDAVGCCDFNLGHEQV